MTMVITGISRPLRAVPLTMIPVAVATFLRNQLPTVAMGTVPPQVLVPVAIRIKAA